MPIPNARMRQLLEAGVHFGHHTRRWNPKMAPYIFGVRNGIHVIDLEQTEPMLHQGLQAIRDVVAGGGRVLLVGTKRQAQEPIAEAAKRCGQYHVNHRWLGGMLTNFKTISQSIRRLREVEERIVQEQSGLTKRELLELTRRRDKYERALGGIKEMGGLPDILFVIDTNKEAIAVAEANTLRIPVVAILDSNSSPDGIAYPIPGNDDAMRAIQLYCDLVSSAVLDGLQAELAASGVDIGARAEVRGHPPEDLRGTRGRRIFPRRRAEDRGIRAPRPRRCVDAEAPTTRCRVKRKRRRSGTLRREFDENGGSDRGTRQRAARENRRRHDGLQEGAWRYRWRHRGRRRLAEEEGSLSGRQQGRAGCRRGPYWGRDARPDRRCRRSQFRDRLRRPQQRISDLCSKRQRART